MENTEHIAPFGPIFIIACDALGIDPTGAAVALVKHVPKAEVKAINDFDGVVRIIVKAFAAHVESAIRSQHERGLTAPKVDATGPDVDSLYAAVEEPVGSSPNDLLYVVPGNGTIN